MEFCFTQYKYITATPQNKLSDETDSIWRKKQNSRETVMNGSLKIGDGTRCLQQHAVPNW